jgi:hypothetical protein
MCIHFQSPWQHLEISQEIGGSSPVASPFHAEVVIMLPQGMFEAELMPVPNRSQTWAATVIYRSAIQRKSRPSAAQGYCR